MSFDEYTQYDALGLVDLMERGEVSSAEVVEAATGLATARNDELGAIVTPMFDEARAAARVRPEGPLGGVPFLVKDLNAVAGVRCSMGSRLWADYVPGHDAEVVRRFRDAGLVIMGKSNTPEVGLAATTEGVFLGPAHNPWDLGRTPGGSSGGAAAAVAGGIVPVAHATDGGGSIRIPASCCGLVGLKPTRGRTPLGPDVGEGWGGMSTGLVVSRTVRDSAACLDAIHGAAPGDPYHPPAFDGSFLDRLPALPSVLRIGIDLEPITGQPVHEECIRAVERTAMLCDELGHDVGHMKLDYDREATGAAAGLLVAVNVSNTISRRAADLGVTPSLDNVEALTLRFVEWGRSVDPRDYPAAIQTIQATGRAVDRHFEAYDLILSPTLMGPPPALGFMDTMDENAERYTEHFLQFWGFTNLYNATGNPAISLPLHRTEAGLPVGVQFAARFGNEMLLLQLAAQLEEAAPWPLLAPRYA